MKGFKRGFKYVKKNNFDNNFIKEKRFLVQVTGMTF